LARATSVGAAVAGMGARFGAGDDALAKIVRGYQDAVEEWRRLDKKLIAAVGQPKDKHSHETIKQLRTRLAGLDRRIKSLDGQLTKDFPEYAELASPRPMSLGEAQKLLKSDEAMLSYLVGEDETFLWVVRNGRVEMKRLDIGQAALDEAVRDLRAGLDLGLSDLPAFDTTQAFKLYGQVFAAAEPLLKGVRHLFVVPDGPLQSLPLGVLVTKKPQKKATDFSGYLQTPWLARKYALTTLPSVSSLKALRTFAKAARASKPFKGFGDPLLKGHPGQSRGIPLKKYFKPQGGVDVEMVRTRLAPLPETADELIAMANSLGAGQDSLFLRGRATETAVKSTDLSDARVLAFATHGLVAGELGGLAEPALVLTPPRKETPKDDGLLTASEVATLKLNSELVILSACNTAASDGTPNADALSGLAKAFFYAGSRSLLVSHWPVQSDAAVKLTTKMLKVIANDNKIGRSEALRRSMLALMEDKSNPPEFAHPAYWAPFVVVGEGGASRSK
jgi:CHAT domain-containing protein